MIARTIAIAVGSALVGLQMPLCAVACTAVPAARVAPMHADAEPGALPCHAGSAPEPAAPDDAPSHTACGCGGLARVIPAHGPAGERPPAATRPLQVAASPLAAAVVYGGDERGASRVPPPDVLLLTTTLLI